MSAKRAAMSAKGAAMSAKEATKSAMAATMTRSAKNASMARVWSTMNAMAASMSAKDTVVSWDPSSRTKALMIDSVRYVSKTLRLESFKIGPFPVHGLPAFAEILYSTTL